MSVIVLSNAIPDGSLNGGITNVATSLTLQTGEGATFPTPPFKIGINSEAMLCTAKATDTLTVTRNYDGTTATAHSDTDVVKHIFTAEDFPFRLDDTTDDYMLQKDIDLNGNEILGLVTDTWMNALFERPSDETAHTDDDEFDGTIGGTAAGPTGTVTWAQKRSLLAATFASVGTDDVSCRLYALTPTTHPVTIETCQRMFTSSSGTPVVGIVLADGTATTSNVYFFYLNGDTTGVSQRHGTMTSITSQSAGTARQGSGEVGLWYMRVIWTAANTFKAQLSNDGIVWADWGLSSVSKTMTPTHFGVGVSNWGGTEESHASWEYLRVTESDLSA